MSTKHHQEPQSTYLTHLTPQQRQKAQRQAEAELERRRRVKAEKQSRPANPVDWIQQWFLIPERRDPQTGKALPIQLAPYQQAVLQEAYRQDQEGKFIYSIIVWSDIKKSIKSCIAGAVALERASRIEYGSIKVVANDLKQADSRVAYYARRAIELNPALAAITYIKPLGGKIKFNTTKTTIEPIPVDPKGEAGGNDDLIIFSELWAANQKAALQMWTEMTLSPTKFGQSQRWVETYAGFAGESPLLEQLFELGVQQGRRLDLSYQDKQGPHDLSNLEVYANDAARLLVLWNTHPRLPWQVPDYYAQEASILTPEEFNRIHRNQWVTSMQKFIPIDWWDACKLSPLPEPDQFREVVVALDAGVSDDCFAMVAVGRSGDKFLLRHLKVWKPAKGEKMRFSSPADPTDRDYPEGELRWLADNWNVVCWTYDPYQLHSFCTHLRDEGVGFFEEFSQGQPRLIADKALYDAIRERRIQHQGEPTLREHLDNANSTVEEKDTLRIVKRSPLLKIDAAVALSMAVAKAEEYLPE